MTSPATAADFADPGAMPSVAEADVWKF